MAIATPDLPSSRLKLSSFCAPISTRATSRTRTTDPSGLARTHEGTKLLRRRQRPFGLHIKLKLLVVANGPGADPADRRLDILRIDDVYDFGRRHIEVVKALDVEPYPHGIFESAEGRSLAPPRAPRQLIELVDGRVFGGGQRGLFPLLAVDGTRRRMDDDRF